MKTQPISSSLSRPISISMAFAIAYCLVLMGSGRHLQAQVSQQMPSFPKDKTVIEMTPIELRSYYSELLTVDFNSHQNLLNSLLAKTGERVQEFFHDFSDTSSREFVLLQMMSYSGGVKRQDIRDFRYLIVYRPNGAKPSLEEFRTNKNNNRSIPQDAIKGFYITSGYACMSLNFHPSYQQGLRFRYLGQQTSHSRAHIIAFAQKLDTKDLLISFTDTGSRNAVRLPVQGIALVNPDTYQILQLRVNLLAAGNQSSLAEQTTQIKYGEVRFDDSERHLWLPKEVIVTTQTGNQIFRNLHRYSDYKIFAVKSDFRIEKPGARN